MAAQLGSRRLLLMAGAQSSTNSGESPASPPEEPTWRALSFPDLESVLSTCKATTASGGELEALDLCGDTCQLCLGQGLRFLLSENTLIIYKWEAREQNRIIRWHTVWELNMHFVFNSFFYSLLFDVAHN